MLHKCCYVKGVRFHWSQGLLWLHTRLVVYQQKWSILTCSSASWHFLNTQFCLSGMKSSGDWRQANLHTQARHINTPCDDVLTLNYGDNKFSGPPSTSQSQTLSSERSPDYTPLQILPFPTMIQLALSVGVQATCPMSTLFFPMMLPVSRYSFLFS